MTSSNTFFILFFILTILFSASFFRKEAFTPYITEKYHKNFRNTRLYLTSKIHSTKNSATRLFRKLGII